MQAAEVYETSCIRNTWGHNIWTAIETTTVPYLNFKRALSREFHVRS